MGLFNSIRMGSSGAGGDYEVERSLRFNKADLARLERTPSSTGNQKVWTFSAWFKRTRLADSEYFISSYGNNDGIAALYFDSSDRINTYYDTSGANPYGAVNQRKYRDCSAWMHIVWQVDAISEVQKIWVNGVEESLDSAYNPPNFSYTMNQSGQLNTIGGAAWYPSGTGSNMYLAEIHFSDGNKYTPSDFVETDALTGQLIPKKVAITYGTNGYYLNFSDNSGTTATTLGKDSSGNGNNWTPTNLAVSDSITDTPTNNFCTLNPLNKTNDVTLKEGNLEFFQSSNDESTTATFNITSGKWYWEVYKNSGENPELGIETLLRVLSNKTDDVSPTKVCIRTNGGDQQVGTGTPTSITGSSGGLTGAGVVGIAVDFDNKKIWYSDLSGNFFNSGNPATGANAAFDFSSVAVADKCVPYFFCGTGGNNSFNVNFGQDATFAGHTTAGGNSDGNGYGNFKYSVPSGYLALCSANLPDPTIKLPNKHFDTLLYTGNDTTNNITGLNFAPDFVWIKNRSNTGNHLAMDTVRGLNNLRVNLTNTESSNGSNHIQTFNSDGFTLAGSGGNSNDNGNTYVAWNWNAGGSTVTNNDGNNTSQVRANTSAGFSIVSYTGNGTNNSNVTMGHGLGVTPDFVIVKNRDSAKEWVVWHKNIGTDSTYVYQNLALNTSGADSANSDQFRNVDANTIQVRSPDSSNGKVNKSGDDYISYVFSSVEGYSKFGKYTGNNANNGTFVFTGFSVAWLMVKRIDSTTDWLVYDNKRSTSNVIDDFLEPNQSGSEQSSSSNSVDFLSNGFKFRNNSGDMNGAGTYVYMAFAESPFKYSRAR